MRALMAVFALTALSACARAAETPEATIAAVYEVTQRTMGTEPTPLDSIPLSANLAEALADGIRRAEARNEPFIEGDLPANCQDCRVLSDLALTTTAPPENGRAIGEARFKLDGAPRVVLWDMLDSPEGWRVDNIRSPDGFDLRASIAEYAGVSCAEERGAEAAAALVAQCTQVSPATHPPCNAGNDCALIEAEITRGCGMLAGDEAPAFCAAEATP
jgi:hypothetical protein